MTLFDKFRKKGQNQNTFFFILFILTEPLTISLSPFSFSHFFLSSESWYFDPPLHASLSSLLCTAQFTILIIGAFLVLLSDGKLKICFLYFKMKKRMGEKVKSETLEKATKDTITQVVNTLVRMCGSDE